MIKIIQRKTDNKYLKSIDNNLWVDDIKEAFEMTYRECENAKSSLEGILEKDQIKEIVDFNKLKPLSEEEKQEIINLLKK